MGLHGDPAAAGSLFFQLSSTGYARVSPHESRHLPKIIPDTPSAPEPMGPYSLAAEAGGLVFLAGQVGLDPATGERAPDDVAAQTRQVMSNIGGILADLGLGYGDIVKTTVFLADIGDFSVMNEVYAPYFEAGFPARSAVQAGALPGGFLVEIEVVAAR